MARKQTDSIKPEQLRRMLTRYLTVIAGRLAIDGGDNPKNLEHAQLCANAALGSIDRGAIQDARHLTGFVQGILLCTGIHTWEYLATDDQRE